ncbi:hypothetical protein ACQZV8_11845 [Magnetococcales bacterium HHB-1]
MKPQIWTTLFLSLLVASPAWSHKLKLFAMPVGEYIEGTVYFIGGIPAVNLPVKVESPKGTPRFKLQTDAKGLFTFPFQPGMDHFIRADSGDGHRAELLLSAQELTPASHAAPSKPTSATTVSSSDSPSTSSTAGCTSQEISAMIAQQIQPLRHQLNAYEDRVRLQDILGGIGYIIGLAGIALWHQNRHRKKKQPQQAKQTSPSRDNGTPS